jgi:hypothetical protein
MFACLGVAAAHPTRVAVSPVPKPRRGAVPWPAPPDPLVLARRAGLKPERREMLAYHVHSHLDVFVNGKPVRVPAGLGINIADPGVKRFELPDGSVAYGGIQLCSAPCISPLHTHDDTGVIHTETSTPRPNRLSQLFTEWGVRLSRKCVGGYCRPGSIQWYVNGKRFLGNPRDMLLSDRKEIALVIGTPPKHIPTRF